MMRIAQAAIGLSLILSLPLSADGDAEAGQQKAAVCAACHGADGNSTVVQWPKIAGQHEAYLARQMILIRDGGRPVPEMAPMVASFSDQDVADLAAFFAGQSPRAAAADEALAEAGEGIWRAGNPETGVPACMACHGPAGAGNPLAGYPALAGQHAVYTANMLKDFKAGQVFGEEDAPSRVMSGVAAMLSDEEITAVSSYIQGLHRAGD